MYYTCMLHIYIHIVFHRAAMTHTVMYLSGLGRLDVARGEAQGTTLMCIKSLIELTEP
jgi:hypothetical protein